MKSYYKKAFEAESPFILLGILLILWLGFVFRKAIIAPEILSSAHAGFLVKFGLSPTFFSANTDLLYGIVFILSMLTIIILYFLGKEIIGKIGGLATALFFTIYPYFVVNTYSATTTYLFFFLLYLFFCFKGFSTMLRRWSLISGILFAIAIMLEPSLLIIGIIPLIYYALKTRHAATFQQILFFFIGICCAVGFFVLVAVITSTLPSLLPSFNVFNNFGSGFKLFISHPISYIANTIWPYIQNNFSHPLVAGTHSYLHYVIITLTVLGALYSIINEKVRVVSIITVIMFIQAFFMPFSYATIFIMFLLLAGYMIDKVISDVFRL